MMGTRRGFSHLAQNLLLVQVGKLRREGRRSDAMSLLNRRVDAILGLRHVALLGSEGRFVGLHGACETAARDSGKGCWRNNRGERLRGGGRSGKEGRLYRETEDIISDKQGDARRWGDTRERGAMSK